MEDSKEGTIMICKQHFFFMLGTEEDEAVKKKKTGGSCITQRRFGHVGVGSVGNWDAFPTFARDGRLDLCAKELSFGTAQGRMTCSWKMRVCKDSKDSMQVSTQQA